MGQNKVMNSALGGRAQAHFPNSAYTVELPRATTFRKRPPPMSDFRFKTPKRSRSKPKSWSLGWGGGGGLRISSDGDKGRIFLGWKFLILGFFGGRKIWQVIFWVP